MGVDPNDGGAAPETDDIVLGFRTVRSGVMGRLVSYGATSGPKVEMDLRHVFWKQISYLGSTMGTPGEFRTVMGLVFAGTFKPVIHAVLPLEEARRAHELLESGSVFGKLILVP